MNTLGFPNLRLTNPEIVFHRVILAFNCITDDSSVYFWALAISLVRNTMKYGHKHYIDTTIRQIWGKIIKTKDMYAMDTEKKIYDYIHINACAWIRCNMIKYRDNPII